MTEIVFSEQVRALHGPLWHIAWAILRNGADCDDAIQETWLRAWNRIGNLRDETAFDAWLVRILVQQKINKWPFLHIYAILISTYKERYQ